MITYRPPFSNFDSWLKSQAKKHGSKPAIVFNDFLQGKKITVSYRQLDLWTNQLANLWLKHWDLKPGDKLAFAFKNRPEIILINYACWRAGLVSVPLDVSRDTPERKKYKLKFTGAKALISYQPSKLKIKGLKTVSYPTWEKFKAAFLKINPAPLPGVSPDQDALILFTSGTTALPKGARLTLTNLWANAESIAAWLKFKPTDRWQVVLPLHHINSTTFVNTTLSVGATVILVPQYSKSRFWALAARNKVTGTSIVPTIAYDLLSEQKSFQKQAKKLKFTRIQIGSAPVQPTVVESFLSQYKIPLFQGYGQTETALRSAGVPMDLSKKQLTKIRQLNSLGANLKYTQVTVLDKKGKPLPAKKVGEICVKGPIIMAGYLKNPVANKEAFAFGWFHSGDTGYWQNLFNRKFFFLKGRTKEIIKKGGVLISPLAVENALLKAFPKLKPTYVVGFPDPRLGEEVGVVSVSPRPEKFTTKLKLKAYEQPQAWITIKATDLPKTSTGKVQRVKIKERFGPMLLNQYRTVLSGKDYDFRLLGPEETGLLTQAVKINNQRWGKGLTSSLDQFKKRAQNGLLLAAINNKNHRVEGTVSALRLNQKDLPSTWDQVTGKGTLLNHQHAGDSLVCVAISVKSRGRIKPFQPQANRSRLTASKLKAYLASNQDPVIRFHRKLKGGLKVPAKIIKVLPYGRPADKQALGYNVVFRYPTLKTKPRLNSQASLGVQLIEAALIYAYQKGVKTVLAFSRPADLGKHFKA